MTHDTQDPSVLACPEEPLSGDRLLQLQSEVEALRRESIIFRAQLELRDLALDATPTRYIVVDHRGPEPIIVYCNKSVAQQHGFRREELIGQSIKLIAQWDRGDPSIPARIMEALAAGQTFRYEHEVVRPDGSCFWVGVAVVPIMDGSGTLKLTARICGCRHHRPAGGGPQEAGSAGKARHGDERTRASGHRASAGAKSWSRWVAWRPAWPTRSIHRFNMSATVCISCRAPFCADMNRFADDARLQTLDAVPDSPRHCLSAGCARGVVEGRRIWTSCGSKCPRRSSGLSTASNASRESSRQ